MHILSAKIVAVTQEENTDKLGPANNAISINGMESGTKDKSVQEEETRKQELRDQQKVERDHLLVTTERLIRSRRENLSFLKDELELIKEKYQQYKESLSQLKPLCHAKPRKPRDISILMREYIHNRDEFKRNTKLGGPCSGEWSDDSSQTPSSQSSEMIETDDTQTSEYSISSME